jgi:hypothetical protein
MVADVGIEPSVADDVHILSIVYASSINRHKLKPKCKIREGPGWRRFESMFSAPSAVVYQAVLSYSH